jgi:hypothetical protein
MSDIEVHVTEWKGNWPLKGRADVHGLRIGIGGPPEYTRQEQTVAMLRLAATVCTRTADKLERDEGGVEYTTHVKIPRGDW